MTAKPDASLKPIVNDHNASNDASGVLRLDRSSRLPTALAEASEHDEHGWLPSGLVITITLLAIVLITIITWFISQMPSKP